MNPSLEHAAGILRTQWVVDYGRLKSGGRAELEAALKTWRSRNLTARIVLLPRDTAIEPWHALFEQLGLNPASDLLLISNGARWEAKGWSLKTDSVQEILGGARADLRVYFAKGLVTAVNRLGKAASSLSAPPPKAENESNIWVPLGLTGLAVAGLAGWVIRRRQQLALNSQNAIAALHSSAEQAYADLVLDAENIPSGEESTTIHADSERIKKALDALQIEISLGRAQDTPVTRGRILQLENELAALHSTIRQQLRRN